MQSGRGSDEWRFAIHPAYGLKLTGPGEPRIPRPTQLGLAWLRLSRDEQARRRRAFFTTLLEPWIGAATFQARGLGDEAARRLTWFDGVATGDGEVDDERSGENAGRDHAKREPAVVGGPLTAAALDELLGSEPSSVVVQRDGGELLSARECWQAAVVQLTEDEEDAARARLDAAASAARAEQAACADRRGRALAYLAFHYALLALAVLVGWLALRQLGTAFPTALAIALGVAVAVTFFSLLSPLQRAAANWYGLG